MFGDLCIFALPRGGLKCGPNSETGLVFGKDKSRTPSWEGWDRHCNRCWHATRLLWKMYTRRSIQSGCRMKPALLKQPSRKHARFFLFFWSSFSVTSEMRTIANRSSDDIFAIQMCWRHVECSDFCTHVAVTAERRDTDVTIIRIRTSQCIRIYGTK